MPTYMKGRVAPPNLAHLRMLSFLRHEPALKALPVANQASWDSRTMGWIGPPKDQAQCGSCWCFSGTGVVETAMYKAGLLKSDGSQALSEEYTLSCGRNGGCNGDDNTTVLADAKAHGLPLTSAYGPYSAGSGRPTKCVWTPNMTLYKLTDWGFADSNGGQGVTKTQDIKNAIAYYGCVGCAIAADDAFMNMAPGTVFKGSGSTEIDHDVEAVGWDNARGRLSGAMDPSLVHVKAAKLTALIGRNSWGDQWCDGGYFWIEEGANLFGTESVFGFVTGGPVPPTPIPPAPVGPTALMHLHFAKTQKANHPFEVDPPVDVPAGVWDLVPGVQGHSPAAKVHHKYKGQP